MAQKIKRKFKRPCKRCGETFQPVTRFQKLCDKCHEKALKTNKRGGTKKK